MKKEMMMRITDEKYELSYRKDDGLSFLHFDDSGDRKIINLKGSVDVNIVNDIFTSDANLIDEDIFTYKFNSPTGYLEFPVSPYIVDEMEGCSCGYYKQIYVRTEDGKRYHLEIGPSSEAFYILTSVDNDIDEYAFTVKVKNVPLNEVSSVFEIFYDMVAEENWDF
ncbi:hypothetical protein ON064_03045 [Planococcus sp. A6]|uniref:hypothetical protein n=1 Tax=Planococcus sp. A6 TaxID=2992760 RepID=UPI00237C4D26|nr:hypothetical protein [Planococcus sp. A6]MDE0582021.1 hypothetical protein [Planococcus sp. A6]